MRFLVNRDATFLSLLGNGLALSPSAAVTTTCCNPFGKPRQVVQNGDAVSYAAAVTMCGLQAKLEDEVADRGRGPSRVALQGFQSILSRPMTKARIELRRTGFPVEQVQDALREQPGLEQEAADSGRLQMETLSQPSAFAFGKIVRHTAQQACDALEAIGQSLGTLIYTLDAYVDRKRDARSGQFNPFLLQPALRESMPDTIDQQLSRISQELASLPLTTHRNVLHAILGPNLQRTCMSVMNEIPLGGHPPSPQQKKKQKKADSPCCNETDCCYGCDCIHCCDCFTIDGSCCDGDLGCCDCDVGCCICDCS